MNTRRIWMVGGLLTAVAASVGLAGCHGPLNRGVPKSYRLESRLPIERANSRLGSADLTVATAEMVEDIVNTPRVRPKNGKRVIVMGRVTNRTSMPAEQFRIFLARIRVLLNQSGARKDLVFIADRQKAERIKTREGYPPEASARALPEYALTGTFYDMPRGRSNYYLLTFQLVDLSTDRIVWENMYEVKL